MSKARMTVALTRDIGLRAGGTNNDAVVSSGSAKGCRVVIWPARASAIRSARSTRASSAAIGSAALSRFGGSTSGASSESDGFRDRRTRRPLIIFSIAFSLSGGISGFAIRRWRRNRSVRRFLWHSMATPD